MPITPKQFLKDIDSLVSLPAVCVRVNELAEDPKSSAVEIAEAISQDPNLTTQILRIANSPFYGFPTRVDTISRAIAVIGTQDLRDLVLSASIIKAFSKQKNEIFNLERYWHHSLFTAFIARQLGSKTTTPILNKERLFLAGLLHDIGKLVMSIKIPEIMRIVKMRSEEGCEPFYEVEKLVFGLGHAEIGAELMRQWNLPKSLQFVAKYHHKPSRTKEFLLEASIVHIANALARHENVSVSDSDFPIKISTTAWKVTGLNKDIAKSCMESARKEFDNSITSFIPQPKVANF